ncbi:D-glycero-alpha-D-manno-heptose-1,7-bisphosphate 7-phosphatase [Synechococcus sp. LTW-G]
MTHQRPALFLDRDGVINVDYGHVHERERFHFVPGIFQLVRTANQYNYQVIVVTNQSGIARGYYTQETFSHLTQWMLETFNAEGALITAVYHCPHHPTEGTGPNTMTCQCRKPQPGLFFQATADFDILVPHSIMIGDNISDLLAAHRAGITNLFLFNNTQNSLESAYLIDSVSAISDLSDKELLRLIRSH